MNAPAWPCICGGGPMNLKKAFKPKTTNMRPSRTRTMTMTYFINVFVLSVIRPGKEILIHAHEQKWACPEWFFALSVSPMAEEKEKAPGDTVNPLPLKAVLVVDDDKQ